MASLLGRFELGVGGEGVSVFDDVERVGVVGQRLEVKTDRPEQLDQLLAFLSILGAQYEQVGMTDDWRLMT